MRETCQVIYEELSKTEFMQYNKQNWLNVANEFFEKWNMPNCLGAVDGKHVKIKCPPQSGSLYYNYKVCSPKNNDENEIIHIHNFAAFP